MKCVNIKLWDILGCFHYILNAPRTVLFVGLTIQIHCATLLRVMCLFAVSDDSFEQQTIFICLFQTF